MNSFYTNAETTNSAEICYLSPRGHYYVAKSGLDTRYARYAQLINRYQPSQPGKAAPSQLELAKRSSRS